MKIKNIEIKNFRNLENINFEPDEKTNIICGMNAQGKTNLIEGIWLFSGFKSFRGAKDSELVKFGSEEARLKIDYLGSGIENRAEIKIKEKRNFTLNGVEIKSPIDMAEESNIVVFSPDYLSIIKDGPQFRRRFLDNAISSVYRTYGEQLKKYNRVIKQRNAILRDLKFNRYLQDIAEDYETVLAAYGERIIYTRRQYLKRIMEYMPEIFAGLTQNREKIEAQYMPDGLEEGSREEIQQALKKNREEDIITGSTSVGPHRDDIKFSINGLNVRSFGSQGQQRSTVLALKLAEAQLLREISSEDPVILLDDVMSELDPYRQDYILNHIKDWQVFITCCDNSQIERLERGKTVKIERGKIEE